jgi:hypothetical protein
MKNNSINTMREGIIQIGLVFASLLEEKKIRKCCQEGYLSVPSLSFEYHRQNLFIKHNNEEDDENLATTYLPPLSVKSLDDLRSRWEFNYNNMLEEVAFSKLAQSQINLVEELV